MFYVQAAPVTQAFYRSCMQNGCLMLQKMERTTNVKAKTLLSKIFKICLKIMHSNLCVQHLCKAIIGPCKPTYPTLLKAFMCTAAVTYVEISPLA